MKTFEVVVEKNICQNRTFRIESEDEFAAGEMARHDAKNTVFEHDETVKTECSVLDMAEVDPTLYPYTVIATDERGLFQFFNCEAEDDQHANEQLEDAYPGGWLFGFLQRDKCAEERLVTVYFDVESDDADAMIPAFAKIIFTAEMINEISRVAKESKKVREIFGAKLSIDAPLVFQEAIQWESQNVIKPIDYKLSIWSESFTISALPKNGGARFDTYPMSLEMLQKLIELEYNSLSYCADKDDIIDLMGKI